MRSCIFCGGDASSNEHVFATWLLDVLDGLAPEKTPIVHHERGDLPLRVWHGGMRTLTVKHVCRRCNNGWMSELEGCAKPILTPLILGAASVLDGLDQITVASWAFKTAVVFEATRVGGPKFYSLEERLHLRENSVPPRRTSVWLGQYKGHLGAYCRADDLDSHVEESFQRMDMYVTTMSLGRLVIQVGSGHFPPSVPLRQTIVVDQSPGPWDAAARRIWPASNSPVSWPPRVTLSDGNPSLEAFATRWE